jgi:hypothetical protein
MEDWIDRLKSKETGQDKRSVQQNEIRLHNAKIINAKGRVIWDAMAGFLDIFCRKLREEFPNQYERHCHLDNFCNRVVIVNEGPLPRLELSVELNLDGQCIEVVEATKYDRLQEASDIRKARIEITSNNQEELEFRYIGKAHTTPESLAQALVSRVCKIH